MSKLNYNKELLDAISKAKAGNTAKITLKVAVSKSNNIIIDNALNQWALFFNTIYSPTFKCKGNLDLHFIKVGKETSDIRLAKIKKTEVNVLAKTIEKIGKQLGLNLDSKFISRDYILYNNLITDKKGIINDNGLVKNSKLKSQTFSKYGSPSTAASVRYGVTNVSAVNYDPKANKNSGEAVFNFKQNPRVLPSNNSRAVDVNYVPVNSQSFGGAIDISVGDSYYNLEQTFESVFNEQTFEIGNNEASFIPDAELIANTIYPTESLLITNSSGFIECVVYKNNVGHFNVSDRYGNIIKGTNKILESEATAVVNVRKNTSVPIGESNEGTQKLSTSNLYSITVSNTAHPGFLESSYALTAPIKVSSILFYNPREIAFLSFDHNIPNYNSNREKIYDCNDPENGLGNAVSSNTSFGSPASDNASSGFSVYPDFFDYSKWMLEDVSGDADLQNGSLGSKRFSLEPAGGVDQYMTNEDVSKNGYNVLEKFKSLHAAAGGNISEWYWPLTTKDTSSSTVNGLEIDICNPLESPFATFSATTYSNLSPGVNPNQKLRTSKIIPIIQSAPPMHSNIYADFPITGENIPGASVSNDGIGDFKYVDTSTNSKYWQGSYIVFDLFTSQFMNLPVVDITSPEGNSKFATDTIFGQYSFNAGNPNIENTELLPFNRTAVYGRVDGNHYYMPITQSDTFSMPTTMYIKGFDFNTPNDISQYGIIRLAGSGWENNTEAGGSYGFVASTDYSIEDPTTLSVAEASIVVDTSKDDELFKLLSYCPAAISFKKKSIAGTDMGDTNKNPFVVMPDQPADTVGCYVMAYAVLHGFVLMYMNEYGQFLPLTDSGVYLPVPGGDISNENVAAEKGYMPVSMQFTENDNYLYTIVKSKTTDLKYICIYDVSSIALGQTNEDSLPIANSAVMLENPFAGDLTRVDRGHDGAMYFFSHNSNEYIKITEPGLSVAVSQFASFTKAFVKTTSTNFDFLPSMSSNIELDNWLEKGRHKVRSAEETVPTSAITIYTSQDIPTYYISDSNFPKVVFNTNTFNVNVESSEISYIQTWINTTTSSIPITEFPSTLGQLTSSAALKYSSTSPGYFGSTLSRIKSGNSFGSHTITNFADTPIVHFVKTLSKVDSSSENQYHKYSIIPNSDSSGIYIGTTKDDILLDSDGSNAETIAIKYFDAALNYAVENRIYPDHNTGAKPFITPSIVGVNNRGLWPGVFGRTDSATNHYYVFSFPSKPTDRTVNLTCTQYSTAFSNNYQLSAHPTSTLSVSNLNCANSSYLANGFGEIQITENSYWIINLELNEFGKIALRFNKLDNNFNAYYVKKLYDGGTYESPNSNIEFSSTHLVEILADLQTAELYSNSLENLSEDQINSITFSSYSNLQNTSVTFVINLGQGDNYILVYSIDKELGELTLINCDALSTYYRRASNLAGAGDYNFTKVMPKKLIYDPMGFTLYILGTNQSGDYGRVRDYLMQVDLLNLESTLTQAVVRHVDPFPDTQGEGLPPEFSNSFDPRFTIANSVDSEISDISAVSIDNIFIAKDYVMYISARKILSSDFAGPNGEDEYPSLGVIVNSINYNNTYYALFAIKTGDVSYKDIFSISYATPSEAESQWQQYKNDTSLDNYITKHQIKIKGPEIASNVSGFNLTTTSITYSGVTGCMDEYNSIGLENCNYISNATIPSKCVSPENNGPEAIGGTGAVAGSTSEGFVECDCGESIEPQCSECYATNFVAGTEENAAGAPDPGATCGVCADLIASNYQEPVFGFSVEDNSRCNYSYCGNSSACNFVSPGTPTPSGQGYWVQDDSLCSYPFSGCDCDNELLPNYCGTCGQATFLQEGLEEGYCDCLGAGVIPSGSLSDYQNSTSPQYWDGKYCSCEGDLPVGTHCDCNGTPIEKVYMGGFPQQNSEKPCNCEGETSEQLYGIYCGCTGQVNVSGACDCNNMPVPQYVDNDGDGLGVAPAEQLCPVVNDDGSLSPQPGYSFTGGDTSDNCAGEYDECGICRSGGFDDPDFCSDGEDQCGVCCGNDECLDCHGVPNGPGQLPANPCPGYKYCDCTQTYILEENICPEINEGCGCGQGPETECGTCEGPDGNGCCSGNHFDQCLDQCVPSSTTLTIEDECGNCFTDVNDPDFNSCVGCIDEEALNYSPTYTIPCTGCCEYETYVPPIYDVQPDVDGEIISNFNTTTAFVSLPAVYPENGIPLFVIGVSAFYYDNLDLTLPDGWPACLEDGSCTGVDTTVLDQINNVSYSPKVQVVDKNSPKIFTTNAHKNGEIHYNFSVEPSGGAIYNIRNADLTQPGYNHYRIGEGDNSIQISNINLTPTFSGTTNANFLQVPTNSTLYYSPKFYFTLAEDLDLTTYDASNLFGRYPEIQRIVKYTLAIPEDGTLKSYVENSLNPIAEIIYDKDLRITQSLISGSPYESGVISDFVGGYTQNAPQVYELIPVKNSDGTTQEVVINFSEFITPEPDLTEVCCAACAPNYMQYTQPSGNWASVAPSLHEGILNGTNPNFTCNSDICEDCPVPPCPGGYETKCCDPAANNYSNPDSLEECETCSQNNANCNYLCTGVIGGTVETDCSNPIKVCTDQAALNYFGIPDDNTACCYIEDNNNQCDYYVPIYGCTSPSACNYNPLATDDDGTCDFDSCYGCMDSTACNYDSDATYDNGTCTFAEEGFECDGEPIEPGPVDPVEPVDPIVTGWKIKTVIYTNGVSIEDLQKLNWIIYDSDQNVLQVSPTASQYSSTTGALTNVVSINNIVGSKCLWFLPLGVEKSNIWAHADLEIIRPNNTVYHSIHHGFGYNDTGSILLSTNSNCSIGCIENNSLLTTENCTVYVKEDTKDHTTITVQAATSFDLNLEYSKVVVRVIDIDKNKVLATLDTMYSQGIFSDSFTITKDVKIAMEYINPENLNAPLEIKLIGEFGDLITKKYF